MATRARALRVPDALQREIEREIERRGTGEWSSTVLELVDEAIRMRRAPGIIFVYGPSGRQAVIAGTGLEVWEIISSWRQMDRDVEALPAGYPWLSEIQLRAALSYYQLYPEEIDARIDRDEQWTPERVWREMPFTRPRQ